MEVNIPNAIKSFIRVLHASPQTPAVDVYINSIPTIKNLQYKGFTEYLPISSGTYNVKLFRAGTAVLIYEKDIKIAPNEILTVCAIGKDAKDLSLFPVKDPKLQIDTSKSYLRLVHLSPNTLPVDVITSQGIVLFQNVGYTEKQGYISLQPSIYHIDINLSNTTNSVLYVPNMKLLPNKFYTIYLVGLLDDTPPLQVLIPLDGNSYISFFS
ncbi:protein of unknown function [Hathewaya proteolytica DSM 3090]|uniref:DUF4397 domain-containing protein n=1 Tax=Hathewaya proteolytica DSM 3090 TaxID=1121331 RepID=A0A1M6KL87_9CLOT|nr:DUF4397 domain-containing protein [Hathewaya proteolytica]SHJ59727.1 protein of unknown function [Hathewaya proteolytica DSM 3090]